MFWGFTQVPLSEDSEEADPMRSAHNLFRSFRVTGRVVGKMIREGKAANTGYISKLSVTEDK